MRRPRPLVALIIAAATLLLTGSAVWLSPRPAGPGATAPNRLEIGAPKPMPPLSFTDRDGKPLSLQDFKGRLVVLDIWATWCSPCRAEFPRLDRLQAALADQGLVVLPLSVDQGGKKPVERFYDEVKVTALGEYLDPSGSSAKALGLRGLPTTLILDREGREIGRLEGEAAWDSAAMLDLFKRLLG
jgi:thiol-disulfide isomerase/thioredoxin